ncbi:hypothetical protein KP77_15710 [Jeotgalibacillus alimentarius]|uniref:Uncharacterized protein n=1 Tax=Jeotgalibacillus alimentarius TaxID=135826 RepID=A0A0C2W0P1_9BACL|nr:hypothetical protein KP77_15710 [Jeotgalibacillus alimentarius]
MTRIFIYIIGFLLLSSGMIHSLIFMNLIPSGNTTAEYIKYLFSHTETYGIPIGALFIHLSTLKYPWRERHVKS